MNKFTAIIAFSANETDPELARQRLLNNIATLGGYLSIEQSRVYPGDPELVMRLKPWPQGNPCSETAPLPVRFEDLADKHVFTFTTNARVHHSGRWVKDNSLSQAWAARSWDLPALSYVPIFPHPDDQVEDLGVEETFHFEGPRAAEPEPGPVTAKTSAPGLAVILSDFHHPQPGPATGVMEAAVHSLQGVDVVPVKVGDIVDLPLMWHSPECRHIHPSSAGRRNRLDVTIPVIQPIDEIDLTISFDKPMRFKELPEGARFRWVEEEDRPVPDDEKFFEKVFIKEGMSAYEEENDDPRTRMSGVDGTCRVLFLSADQPQTMAYRDLPIGHKFIFVADQRALAEGFTAARPPSVWVKEESYFWSLQQPSIRDNIFEPKSLVIDKGLFKGLNFGEEGDYARADAEDTGDVVIYRNLPVGHKFTFQREGKPTGVVCVKDEAGFILLDGSPLQVRPIGHDTYLVNDLGRWEALAEVEEPITPKIDLHDGRARQTDDHPPLYSCPECGRGINGRKGETVRFFQQLVSGNLVYWVYCPCGLATANASSKKEAVRRWNEREQTNATMSEQLHFNDLEDGDTFKITDVDPSSVFYDVVFTKQHGHLGLVFEGEKEVMRIHSQNATNPPVVRVKTAAEPTGRVFASVDELVEAMGSEEVKAEYQRLKTERNLGPQDQFRMPPAEPVSITVGHATAYANRNPIFTSTDDLVQRCAPGHIGEIYQRLKVVEESARDQERRTTWQLNIDEKVKKEVDKAVAEANRHWEQVVRLKHEEFAEKMRNLNESYEAERKALSQDLMKAGAERDETIRRLARQEFAENLWLSGKLDPQVMDLLTQTAREDGYVIPKVDSYNEIAAAVDTFFGEPKTEGQIIEKWRQFRRDGTALRAIQLMTKKEDALQAAKVATFLYQALKKLAGHHVVRSVVHVSAGSIGEMYAASLKAADDAVGIYEEAMKTNLAMSTWSTSLDSQFRAEYYTMCHAARQFIARVPGIDPNLHELIDGRDTIFGTIMANCRAALEKKVTAQFEESKPDPTKAPALWSPADAMPHIIAALQKYGFEPYTNAAVVDQVNILVGVVQSFETDLKPLVDSFYLENCGGSMITAISTELSDLRTGRAVNMENAKELEELRKWVQERNATEVIDKVLLEGKTQEITALRKEVGDLRKEFAGAVEAEQAAEKACQTLRQQVNDEQLKLKALDEQIKGKLGVVSHMRLMANKNDYLLTAAQELEELRALKPLTWTKTDDGKITIHLWPDRQVKLSYDETNALFNAAGNAVEISTWVSAPANRGPQVLQAAIELHKYEAVNAPADYGDDAWQTLCKEIGRKLEGTVPNPVEIVRQVWESHYPNSRPPKS